MPYIAISEMSGIKQSPDLMFPYLYHKRNLFLIVSKYIV
jgi:hypothetical protein